MADTLLDPTDGGYTSRKLWVIIFTQAMVIVGFVACGLWPLLAPNFLSMIGGLTGLAALYLGSNVAHNWVVAKTATIDLETEAPASPPKK